MFSYVEDCRDLQQHGIYGDQGRRIIRCYTVMNNSDKGLVPIHIVVTTCQGETSMETIDPHNNLRRKMEAGKRDKNAAQKAQQAKIKKEKKKKRKAEKQARESELRKENKKRNSLNFGKLCVEFLLKINSNVSCGSSDVSQAEKEYRTHNCIHKLESLVLSNPNSSMIWTRYMAYHLQEMNIENARYVAERAIKTINSQEEDEKLNVWQAWLNLESKFGDAETLDNVFQEAVKTSDAIKIHRHMLAIHVDAKRYSEIEKFVTTTVRKFKHMPQIWVDCTAALLKVGLEEKSRHVMLWAFQSLPTQEHVNLLVKFAQMEIEFGDKERAKTFFEQALCSHSNRVDVWTSYVDALVQCTDIDMAKEVLERAMAQDFPARKRKALLKKYIDFEDLLGTFAGVTHLRQLAAAYDKN